MKTHLLALGLLYSAGRFDKPAQSAAESELLEKLNDEQDSAAALETVLKTPDKFSALVLYFSAGVAFSEKRLEDSGFLSAAGQLRRTIRR